MGNGINNSCYYYYYNEEGEISPLCYYPLKEQQYYGSLYGSSINLNILNSNNSRNFRENIFINLNYTDRSRSYYNISNDINNKNNDINNNILIPATLENVEKLNPEKKICTICLQNFENFDKIINLTCLHMFHDECIKKWLNENDYCPLCNNKVSISD